jgi:hypothetical protein
MNTDSYRTNAGLKQHRIGGGVSLSSIGLAKEDDPALQ